MQGLAHGHTLSLISLDSSPEEMLTQLPGLVEGKSESTLEDEQDFIPQLPSGRTMGTLRQPAASRGEGRSGGDMAIAWRYNAMPQFSTALNSDFRGVNSRR